jgi:hypothetical protein
MVPATAAAARGGAAHLLAALLCANAAARAASAAGLPNLDGFWLGPASVGMGLGTTFSLVTDVTDKGVQGYVGGMFAVRRSGARAMRMQSRGGGSCGSRQPLGARPSRDPTLEPPSGRRAPRATTRRGTAPSTTPPGAPSRWAAAAEGPGGRWAFM